MNATAEPAQAEHKPRQMSLAEAPEQPAPIVKTLPAQQSPSRSAAASSQTPEPLWPHQRNALLFLRDKNAAMLAMEMGTGKTRVALEYLRRRRCRRALILAPLSVVPHVWAQQARRYLPPGARACALHQEGNAAKLQQLRRFLRSQPNPSPETPLLVAVNYEAAWRGDLAQELLQTPWDLLVLDESHRVKNPRGKAATFVAKLGEQIPYRLALTGTPMPNSPLDLWAQYQVLQPGILPRSYWQFQNQYAVTIPLPAPRKGQRVVAYKNQEDLNRRFRSLAFQVSAAEAIALPPARHTNRPVTLSRNARNAYRQMRQKLNLEFANSEQRITAANAAVMVNKLQQIASGFVLNEERQILRLDDSKQKALTDLLQDLAPQEPVVVFARFTQNLADIAAAAAASGRPCFEQSGQRKQLDQWQQCQQGGVLAAQLQTGGLGIDLTKASHCVYYTLDYNLGSFQQSLARLRRPGQRHSVHYVYLTAVQTIDERILHALQQKENLVNSIVRSQSLPREAEPDPET